MHDPFPAVVVSTSPRRRRCQRGCSPLGQAINVELLVAGRAVLGVGTTHSCTKCTGASAVAFSSERSIPLPTLIPCARPTPIRPLSVRVLVHELTNEHPGDDLHVLVRVRVRVRRGATRSFVKDRAMIAT